MIETITPAEYKRLRAIVDRAEAYRQRVAAGRDWLSAEEAAHPDYAACTNEMRGAVEQYEIRRDLPEEIFAYVGEANSDGMGLDRTAGQTWPITVWTGQPIGYATRGRPWRVHSYVGTHMAQYYARIRGREYTGRSFGPGLYIRLKETAASKRARGAA